MLTAGTADLPVAEEAALTAEAMGAKVRRVYDVGVAGLHRLLKRRQEIADVHAVVVVAGMEGALASVVGGLVGVPVVAVPTSVGYGASFEGVAALLTMLNSCASNVSVMNIDNGFGGGMYAALISRTRGGGDAAAGRVPTHPARYAASTAARTSLSGTPAACASALQSSNSGCALSTSPPRRPRFTRTRPHGVSTSTQSRSSASRSTWWKRTPSVVDSRAAPRPWPLFLPPSTSTLKQVPRPPLLHRRGQHPGIQRPRDHALHEVPEELRRAVVQVCLEHPERAAFVPSPARPSEARSTLGRSGKSLVPTP